MEDSTKKVFYFIGIIVALYIAVRYIVPVLFKIIGFALKTVFFVLFWGAIGFVCVLLIVHLVNMVKNRKS